METIIGVRFKTAGKIYHFSPGQLTIARGQHVIVETARALTDIIDADRASKMEAAIVLLILAELALGLVQFFLLRGH